MDAVQQRKLLGLIGLGVRGRGAIVGVQQVREAARRGKLHLAIAAPDASRNSLEKVLPLLHARGITVIAGPPAIELGSLVSFAWIWQVVEVALPPASVVVKWTV